MVSWNLSSFEGPGTTAPSACFHILLEIAASMEMCYFLFQMGFPDHLDVWVDLILIESVVEIALHVLVQQEVSSQVQLGSSSEPY